MVQINTGEGTLDEAIDALYDANGAYAEPVRARQRPDERMERREMLTILERCIACLPGQTGRVFMMREWLGFETAEICERLGVSAANCRTILHRARMGVRACMQRDWVGAKAKQ